MFIGGTAVQPLEIDLLKFKIVIDFGLSEILDDEEDRM